MQSIFICSPGQRDLFYGQNGFLDPAGFSRVAKLLLPILSSKNFAVNSNFLFTPEGFFVYVLCKKAFTS